MSADIEKILRNPPKVKIPSDLLGNIQREIILPRRPLEADYVPVPFWKRLLPALSFGLLVLGCLVVLGIQTTELVQLQHKNKQLQQLTESNVAASRESAVESPTTSLSAQDLEELERLRAEVEQLRAELQSLPELRAQQAQLREQLKAATDRVAQEDPFAAPKTKADSIACISNLKQIGLGARMWANDHNETFPTDFITMRNELNTPKILVCPADVANYPAVGGWEQFDPSRVSYEFYGTTALESEPNTVLTRCKIHGNVGLADGSAFMNTDNKLNLVTENGRLKMMRTKP
jgi:hypothetical protein